MAQKTYQTSFQLMGQLDSGFARSFQTAGKHMKTLEGSAKSLQGQMKMVDSAFAKGIINESSYKNASKHIEAQIQANEKWIKQQERMDNMISRGEKMQKWGKGQMAEGAGLAAMLYFPVDRAISFEKAMSAVAKQMENARDANGNYTDEFRMMEQRVRDFATTNGMALQSSAELHAELLKMGTAEGELADQALFTRQLSVAMDQEDKMMDIAERMAKTTGLWESAYENANMAYTKRGQTFSKALYADTLNYIDDKSFATGDQLLEVATRSTAGAAQVGMSAESNIAFAAGFIEAGIGAEKSATAMNSMLNTLAVGSEKPEKFHEGLAMIGLTAEEVQEKLLMDPDGTILEVLGKIDSLEGTNKSIAATKIWGEGFQDEISAMGTKAKRVKELLGMAHGEERKGSLKKEYDNKKLTTAFQVEQGKAQFGDALAELGVTVLPEVTKGIKWLTNEITYLKNVMKENPEATSWVMKFLGVLAFGKLAVGAFAFAFGGLFSTVGKFGKFMLETNAAGITRFARLGSFLTRLWGTGSKVFGFLGGAAVSALKFLGSGFIGLISNVGKFIGIGLRFLSANPWVMGIMLIVTAAYYLWENWDKISKWITDAWDWATGKLKNAWTGFCDWFSNKWKWIESFLPDWLLGKSTLNIKANVQANAGGSGEEIPIPENAKGGIYKKGAFLTSFAEESDEAAVPLDGSSRAKSIWTKAGDALGMFNGKVSEGGSGSFQVSYHPQFIIQGNADESVLNKVADQSHRNLKKELEALQNQKRRVSFA